MKLIMLVAGEGSRLRPYTDDKPKCLVKLDSESLLDRQLKLFNRNDINDITLISGYKKERLASKGYPIIYNEKYESTNMVYSLYCAIDVLKKAKKNNESVIVSYGDILFDDIVLEKLIDSTKSISVIADKDWKSYWEARMEDVVEDAESFIINEDGTIQQLGQKINRLEEVEAQYIGLIKFDKQGLNELINVLTRLFNTKELTDKSIKNMYFTDLLQLMIDDGKELNPVYISGNWLEIDTVQDYERLIESGYMKDISIKESRQLLISKFGKSNV